MDQNAELNPVIARMLTDLLPGVLLFVLGQWFGEARAARKAFHATKLSEDESAAYNAVRDAFRAHQMRAAEHVRRQELRWEYEARGEAVPDEAPFPEDLENGWLSAHQYFHQLLENGSTDLSAAAMGVIRAYYQSLQDPNRSTMYYAQHDDYAAATRYLEEFLDRRRVDLGQMLAVNWYVMKWWRDGVAGVKAWWRDWRRRRRDGSAGYRASRAIPNLETFPETLRPNIRNEAYNIELTEVYDPTMLVGILGILAGSVVFLWQLYRLVRFGVWTSLSVADVLAYLGSDWAQSPADWMGLHWLFALTPASLGIATAAVAAAWAWYHGRKEMLRRKYRPGA